MKKTFEEWMNDQPKIKKITEFDVYAFAIRRYKEYQEYLSQPEWRNIKTYDDSCRVCGTTEEEFNARFLNLGLDPDTIFYEKLKIITKAINGRWTIDWNNPDQPKWYPWFRLSSDFGFYASHFGYGYSRAGSSSRLCFKSEEKADYAGKQFTEIYKQFLL